MQHMNKHNLRILYSTFRGNKCTGKLLVFAKNTVLRIDGDIESQLDVRQTAKSAVLKFFSALPFRSALIERFLILGHVKRVEPNVNSIFNCTARIVLVAA
jgi:hypothetical protein